MTFSPHSPGPMIPLPHTQHGLNLFILAWFPALTPTQQGFHTDAYMASTQRSTQYPFPQVQHGLHPGLNTDDPRFHSQRGFFSSLTLIFSPVSIPTVTWASDPKLSMVPIASESTSPAGHSPDTDTPFLLASPLHPSRCSAHCLGCPVAFRHTILWAGGLGLL